MLQVEVPREAICTIRQRLVSRSKVDGRALICKAHAVSLTEIPIGATIKSHIIPSRRSEDRSIVTDGAQHNVIRW